MRQSKSATRPVAAVLVIFLVAFLISIAPTGSIIYADDGSGSEPPPKLPDSTKITQIQDDGGSSVLGWFVKLLGQIF